MNGDEKTTVPARAGGVRWADLATGDPDRAAAFYCALFGWKAHEHRANGGMLTKLCRGTDPVASIYRLSKMQLQQGIPSHWTPYMGVPDLEVAARRAEALGGTVLVAPFAVDGMARIALILDPVGAAMGLWQDDAP